MALAVACALSLRPRRPSGVFASFTWRMVSAYSAQCAVAHQRGSSWRASHLRSLPVASFNDVGVNRQVGLVGRIAGDDCPLIECSLTEVVVVQATVTACTQEDRPLLLHGVLRPWERTIPHRGESRLS